MPVIPSPSVERIDIGAPKEIEITPAMIEAGVEALKREHTLDCSYSQAWELAEDVIRRALAASRKGIS